ncbi:MAG: GIY-YIG nuclease family protein [Candidatus Dadabacteria bacterium]|nr:MAG: GIY-YIG nuclease family protein [Candidatus Dadabacteria bacterium]
MYRVRAVGASGLMYLGQTGRSLRGRARQLAVCYREEMPYNDPHTAAPCLWAYRVEDGLDFEISVSPVSPGEELRAVEDFLLWTYRRQAGRSTACNFGRFHRHYTRPSNRRDGRAGRRLEGGASNPDAGPSLPPLYLQGTPTSPEWMGLAWSPPFPLAEAGSKAPSEPGVYRIWRAGETRLEYVGESLNLRSRLAAHGAKFAGPFLASFAVPPGPLRKYQLREIETDLLGAHYHQIGAPPARQYGR